MAQQIEWNMETDVVVLGYGGAGAVAAISAHDAGARVLVLESTEKGGGNTLVSFGGFLVPTDYESAITYINGLFDLSLSEKDDDVIQVFTTECMKNIEWVQGLKPGVKITTYGGAGFPTVAGAESMKKYIVHGSGKGVTGFAQNLFGILTEAVEQERKIPVMTQTPAKRLVTDSDGAVVGVIAEKDGKEFAIGAKRGVVLATGGYAQDLQMLQNHVKGFPIYNAGHPGNKGDGVRMAQKVGAGLWHMNSVSCGFGIRVAEYEFSLGLRFAHPGHIYVDKNGKRFADESGIEAHAGLLTVDYYDSHALEYPRIPFYAIFAETLRSHGPICPMIGIGGNAGHYEWSKDNSVEIEKGWIVKADTLEALADKLGIDAGNLAQAVSEWNRSVENGNDSQFGRAMPSEASMAAVKEPPFYALEVYPALINTQGGPRRNAKAQVLDAFGEPIPRLYSAGELGSLWGTIYQGSGNIAECLVFGRIAGANVAKEPAS